jgi:hypothetical protein
MPWFERLSFGDTPHNLFEFLNLFALLFELLEIFSELAGFVDRLHASQLAKSASTDACLRSLCPLRESFIARRVAEFGMTTSNGSPFRRVIWV